MQLLLGVALVQGSDAARKFVLGCAAVAAILATEFVSVFARDPALWVLGAVVMVSGAAIVGLLFGDSPSPARMWVAVGAIAVSWAVGLTSPLWAGRFEDHESETEIARWEPPERTFQDKALGVSLRIPPDWVMLKQENDLVPPSESTAVVLAHARGAGFAALVVEPVPPGIATAEDYLSAILKSRQESDGSVVEEGRFEALVGNVPARRLVTKWSRKGARFRGSTLVWRDEDRFFMFVVWALEARRKDTLDFFNTAEGMVSFTPHLGTTAGPAVADSRLDAVTSQVPHLSQGSVALLIKKNGGRELAPTEAFREGHRWASAGVDYLTADETKELGEIMRVVYGSLGEADRARLGAYLERVRAAQPTRPSEDAAMSLLMRGSVSKLPAASRGRMQEIIEHAILMGTMTRG